MLPATAADDRPVFFVGYGGDGTGVDDIAVTIPVKGDDFVAPGPEQMLHGLGLVLIDFAAKGVKGKSHRNTTK
jgi:hypothetical protein